MQQRHLLLGESRAAGRDHILKSAQKNRDAVHLPFDQQRKLRLPDRRFRLVEIEQHLALRIERRLRRVDVLRSRPSRRVSSVRAVNAITRPLSLQMGNITRLRNRS